MLDTREAIHSVLTALLVILLLCASMYCKAVAEMLEKNIASVVISEYLFLRRLCSAINRFTPISELDTILGVKG